MPETYYSDKLYPFMDKVLDLVGKTHAAFYLTGGTALGRHYLQHRYSDDLDLFVNQAGDFRDQVKEVLEALSQGGIAFAPGTASDDFVRILAHQDEIPLKIDFINDVAFHYADLQEAPFFPRIDHWRNILSNKLCALSRREPKDMADILAVAGHFTFGWPDVFSEARRKDLWVEPIEISRMIKEFPVDLLKGVKWVQKIELSTYAAALEELHLDIFHGRDNSLAAKR